MAEYKKKQIKRKAKPTKKVYAENRDIKMNRAKSTPKLQKTNTTVKTKKQIIRNIPTFSIIKGKKLEKNRKNLIMVSGILLFVCIYLIVCSLHPVGMIEYLSSSFLKLGSGKGYNITVSGGETLNAIKKLDHYYVLSENNVEAYNNNGRNIFKVLHGFSKPVLKIGDTRFLTYGQGEKVLKVHKFSGVHNVFNFDNSILAADISKSGTIAVATKTEGYEAKVAVYNKNNKKIYEWFSTDEMVTSLCLNDSGKRLAVATVKASGGAFLSKIYILKYSSAEAVRSFEYNGDIIYNLSSSKGNHIYAVFDRKIEFINITNGKKKEYSSDYSVDIAKEIGNRIITVNTLDANKGEANVYLYNLSGVLKANFKVNGTVLDISIKNQRLHILTDSGIIITDTKGHILSQTKCSFDVKNIIALSDKAVVGISNNTINKYLYEKTEAK